MADKIVRYVTCNRICPCETTDVYLCIGTDLTVAGSYTIPASIVSVDSNVECCSNRNTVNYTYTFSYDETLLVDDYTLLTEDVLGVVCDDCYAKWVKDQIAAIPTPDIPSCCCIEGNTNTVCGCGIFDPDTNLGALYNSIFGYQSGNLFTTADGNTLVGYRQCYNSTTMTNVIAVGSNAMSNIVGATDVVVIGNYNLTDMSPSHAPGLRTIAIGTDAGRFWYDADDNILIGHQDWTLVTAGVFISSKVVALGNSICAYSTQVRDSVLLGHENSYNSPSVINDVSIGGSVNYYGSISYSADNVILGHEAVKYIFNTDIHGRAYCECTKSIFIGSQCGFEGILNFEANIDGVILIGANARFYVPTGLLFSNSIGIGENVVLTKSNQVIIGNSSIVETNLRRVLLAAGAATAGSYPIKFQSGTLLGTPELGAMEFDGSKLYITTATGRKEIAFV